MGPGPWPRRSWRRSWRRPRRPRRWPQQQPRGRPRPRRPPGQEEQAPGGRIRARPFKNPCGAWRAPLESEAGKERSPIAQFPAAGESEQGERHTPESEHRGPAGPWGAESGCALTTFGTGAEAVSNHAHAIQEQTETNSHVEFVAHGWRGREETTSENRLWWCNHFRTLYSGISHRGLTVSETYLSSASTNSLTTLVLDSRIPTSQNIKDSWL